MEPIIDLIWSVEEDVDVDVDLRPYGAGELTPGEGGGGGCCVACCCSVPSIITKWLCN